MKTSFYTEAPAEVRLLDRLRAREAEVMVEIYARYSKIAWVTARKIVGDEAVAEDIVQEIFLRVWSNPTVFDTEKGTLGGWISTAARNRAIDYRRSTAGRISQGKIAEPGVRKDAPAESSRKIYDFCSQLSLRTALDALSPNQKRVIRLTYYEGMSQTEMATYLNRPLGTIKSWVRTALATLRHEFGDPHLERVG
ncbi:MAG: sigma-70 family RNA polymerase sigma factor [Acidobacteriota bacterium]